MERDQHGQLPGAGWTIHAATPSERADARRLVAGHCRDVDELRQLLDILDLWPSKSELAARAIRRRLTTREWENSC